MIDGAAGRGQPRSEGRARCPAARGSPRSRAARPAAGRSRSASPCTARPEASTAWKYSGLRAGAGNRPSRRPRPARCPSSIRAPSALAYPIRGRLATCVVSFGSTWNTRKLADRPIGRQAQVAPADVGQQELAFVAQARDRACRRSPAGPAAPPAGSDTSTRCPRRGRATPGCRSGRGSRCPVFESSSTPRHHARQRIEAERHEVTVFRQRPGAVEEALGPVVGGLGKTDLRASAARSTRSGLRRSADRAAPAPDRTAPASRRPPSDATRPRTRSSASRGSPGAENRR